MQQSTPSWRVFDNPSGDGTAAARPSEPASSGGPANLAQPNVLLAAAALAGALLIGGVALAVGIGGSTGATIEAPETGSAFASPHALAGNAGQIVVDVAGAVVNPGLHRLAIGARVGDAIDAAGGFSPRVDVDRVGRELNLAATLADGDQVRVPSRDDPAVPAPGSGGGGSGDGAGGGALVDLNAATQAELEELPGIGPVTAQKIIAARAEAPFRSVDELRERGLVGEKTFEQLKTLVTAG